MRELDEGAITQVLLILEDRIMHFPKFPVGAGEFSDLCRFHRVWMNLAQREIAKHEAQLVPEMLLQLLHDRVGVAAMRTFVIAVFNQRDRSIVRSLGMVGGCDRNSEL